jgi:hypothetical protein
MCSDSDSRTLRLVAHTLYSNQVFVDSEGIFRVHDWAMSVKLSANHYSHRGLQRQVSREKRADWNWLMAGRSELKKNRKPLICFLNLFLQRFS